MPMLSGYDQFEGLHWETGSLRNALAYQGVNSPHNDQPYSEAMLLGISGGIAMGYFTFVYQGYDPMVQILTRNTFDPLQKIYDRLEIRTNIYQTAGPDKGLKNLLSVLESGLPAIVYADVFSLPYNNLPVDEGMWGLLPILVFEYDDVNDKVSIADRARVPLTVTGEQLAAARGRTKKNKYRLLTYGAPEPGNLESAVEAGIRNCIDLFTEPPPKGAKNNFGFLAYQKWADLLVQERGRGSWQQEYPAGRNLYAALTSAFDDVAIYGKEGGAERGVYAQFLDEASIVLRKPDLTDIAQQFRASAAAWDQLGMTLLPDEVSLLKETRELMVGKHELFLNQGNTATQQIQQMNDRLEEIKDELSTEFPLDGDQAKELKASIRDQVMVIHDIEFNAVKELEETIN